MAEVEGPIQNVSPPTEKLSDDNQTPIISNLNASDTTMASSQQLVQEFDQIMEFDSSAVDELKKQLDYRNLIEQYLQQGEFVYELYAVLVHSGTHRGGHYYAYIKSFEDNKWY